MPPRPAEVRIYCDADVLGLAKVVGRLRPEVTHPGDPGAVVHRRERGPCIITDPATKDPDWIPVVARQGWLIITRDSMIQSRPAELAAVRENNARMVALAGREARGTWEQLEVFMADWRRIDAWTREPGPFIYSVTRRGEPRRIALR